MGLLIDGVWHDKWYDTQSTGGKFKRQESSFRSFIGDDKFKAEKDRYHLYISYACPWAHRAAIFRKLKNLEDIISLSIVKPYMGEFGWQLEKNTGPVAGLEFLHEIYTKAKSDYTGRVTVPVLWDKKLNTIVNNESSEIIRMFNSAFDKLTGNTLDYYPENLRDKIEDINDFVYHNINNGVYKVGFATTQSAYDEAVVNLFNALDKIENILSKSRYLVGDTLTEADWRIFTTLIRFDHVYFGHFKCNLKALETYENISNYICELYQVPGIRETVNMQQIKEHYYISHKTINPTQIVPKGPIINFARSHNRV